MKQLVQKMLNLQKVHLSQLDNENIDFIATSQNVGYDFNDVPTLIHSWMNSDIHRSRMLNKKYNEMGGSNEKLLFTYFCTKIGCEVTDNVYRGNIINFR